MKTTVVVSACLSIMCIVRPLLYYELLRQVLKSITSSIQQSTDSGVFKSNKHWILLPKLISHRKLTTAEASLMCVCVCVFTLASLCGMISVMPTSNPDELGSSHRNASSHQVTVLPVSQPGLLAVISIASSLLGA